MRVTHNSCYLSAFGIESQIEYKGGCMVNDRLDGQFSSKILQSVRFACVFNASLVLGGSTTKLAVYIYVRIRSAGAHKHYIVCALGLLVNHIHKNKN